MISLFRIDTMSGNNILIVDYIEIPIRFIVPNLNNERILLFEFITTGFQSNWKNLGYETFDSSCITTVLNHKFSIY